MSADTLGVPAPDPREILDLYRRGWFPMAGPDSPDPGVAASPGTSIEIWNPDPRAILPLEGDSPTGGLRVSRSLARAVRRQRFHVVASEAPMAVVRECAAPRPGRGETWIDVRMLEIYASLHAAGRLASIEAYHDHEGGRVLAGGVFGVLVGGLFAAESMFTAFEIGIRDASSVCLVHLVVHLRHAGFGLLDLQFANPHTERFGLVEIPRAEYLRRLSGEIDRPVSFDGFDARRAVAACSPATP